MQVSNSKKPKSPGPRLMISGGLNKSTSLVAMCTFDNVCALIGHYFYLYLSQSTLLYLR